MKRKAMKVKVLGLHTLLKLVQGHSVRLGNQAWLLQEPKKKEDVAMLDEIAEIVSATSDDLADNLGVVDRDEDEDDEDEDEDEDDEDEDEEEKTTTARQTKPKPNTQNVTVRTKAGRSIAALTIA